MARRCVVCGKEMVQGYLVDDCDTYCSDECLHTVFTEEEYNEMYENDEAYWTEWEEDDED